MEIIKIDEFTQAKSLVHYINHYICRIEYRVDDIIKESYIAFSMEIKPLGDPDIRIKYIDTPNVAEEEALIKSKIISIYRSGGFKT